MPRNQINKEENQVLYKPAPKTKLDAPSNRTRAQRGAEIVTHTSQEASQEVIKQTKQTNTIMEQTQKEIQQNIANFIPEFSGAEGPHRANELARFLGTADSVYENLKTNNEKEIFNKIIKFKLIGDAYTRINHRQTEDYPTLKKILSSMYATTYTLHELERNFTDIKQSYGETIRNYGYRLIEALEQYKNGYKRKYELQGIDKAYSDHLNTNAVQSFKRGLNNTILKEKIATHKAHNVDEILDETECVERMLTLSTGTHTHQQTGQKHDNQPNAALVICNFCNRPNHTWDRCRIRRNTTQNTQFNTPINRSRWDNNHKQSLPQQNYNTNKQNFSQNNFQPIRPTNNNYQPYRQTTQMNNYPYKPRNSFTPKYCSHCKNTTGHTFEECRSKFLTTNRNQTNDYPRQPQNTNNLEESFMKMRINQVAPRPPDINQGQQHLQQPQNQGNDNGSAQH